MNQSGLVRRGCDRGWVDDEREVGAEILELEAMGRDGAGAGVVAVWVVSTVLVLSPVRLLCVSDLYQSAISTDPLVEAFGSSGSEARPSFHGS